MSISSKKRRKEQRKGMDFSIRPGQAVHLDIPPENVIHTPNCLLCNKKTMQALVLSKVMLKRQFVHFYDCGGCGIKYDQGRWMVNGECQYTQLELDRIQDNLKVFL